MWLLQQIPNQHCWTLTIAFMLYRCRSIWFLFLWLVMIIVLDTAHFTLLWSFFISGWLKLLNCYCILIMFQFSSAFLEGIAEYVDPSLPFISLSKGLELNTLRMMSQIIPQSLRNPRQPFIALSGPSFALELMNKLPTGHLLFLYLINILCRSDLNNKRKIHYTSCL